ncbi:DUF4065 domain-containing protein [Candidatus Saccharibacteria bacterium]|nr:DUF4065 domain-containing protein [Candidatus Saccharibacteria bacterium]MBR6122540.1 DUF4065 domain-containing protein [Candidatus Saccharibacteria bacterium]
MDEKITKLRLDNDYTQEFVAEKLGITRQSYIQTERGTRKPTTDDIEKLAGLYGVPVEEFFYQSQNLDKFKQMYFYVLSKFAPAGIPKTKLAKILYLADFYHYYEDLEPMSGVFYRRRQYGPLADVFLSLTDELYDSGKIDIDYLQYAAMVKLPKISSTESNLEKSKITSTSSAVKFELLTNQEKKQIDKICEYWRERRTSEIVNFTHEQKPWMSCRDGEIIPYSLIIQENPDHVYAPIA